MGLLENILKTVVLQDAIIDQKVKISASVYQIRLKSESLKNAEFEPGYFLRLGIGIGNDELSMKDKVSSYSVWDINKTEGYLDLAIATHSNGIGSKWVVDCKVGDVVYYKWKKGNFLMDSTADSYLMIGDLSALSHLYILSRNLPKGKQVESLRYSQDNEDFFKDTDFSSPLNFELLEQNSTTNILDKIKTIVPKMEGKKMVYIAGDSRVCVALNKYFKNELNWDSKQIKTKPFWNPEKKGLE